MPAGRRGAADDRRPGGAHSHLDILVDRANGCVPKAFWAVFGEIEREYDACYPR